jgi:hypothetical protein
LDTPEDEHEGEEAEEPYVENDIEIGELVVSLLITEGPKRWILTRRENC